MKFIPTTFFPEISIIASKTFVTNQIVMLFLTRCNETVNRVVPNMRLFPFVMNKDHVLSFSNKVAFIRTTVEQYTKYKLGVVNKYEGGELRIWSAARGHRKTSPRRPPTDLSPRIANVLRTSLRRVNYASLSPDLCRVM